MGKEEPFIKIRDISKEFEGKTVAMCPSCDWVTRGPQMVEAADS